MKTTCAYIILLFAALTLCSCASTQNITVKADAGGRIIVEETLDASIAKRLLQGEPGAPIIQLHNVSRNFIFFTDYTFSLNSPSIIDREKKLHADFPIDFVLSFPGSVQNSNADKIENGKAVWNLREEQELVLKLSSRKLNYLNITIVIALGMFLLTRTLKKFFQSSQSKTAKT